MTLRPAKKKKKSKRVYKIKSKSVLRNPSLQEMEVASNVPFSTLLFIYDSQVERSLPAIEDVLNPLSEELEGKTL